MKYISVITAIIVIIVMVNGSCKSHTNYKKLVEKVTQHTADITYIRNKFNYLSTFNKKLQKRLLELEQNVVNPTLVKVKVTYYCPWAGGINADSNPNRTALMTRPKPGYTIAISKALVDKGWLGHKVYIEGFGVGKIEDRMGKSIKGNHIDICIGTLEEAIKKGKRFNIIMVKI